MSLARIGSARTAAWLLDRPAREARSWRRIAHQSFIFAGIALLCALSGSAIAFTGLNALFLAAAVVGCVFILLDFRIGVVLLIVLMPLSSSYVFPHAMLGITGLNPLNLLLAGTLGSCLLQSLFDGSIRRFMPRQLLWLYIVPFLIAGALGARRVGEIPPLFYLADQIDFHSTAGFVRDMVAKPLLIVIFALLVGAAVARSAKPENFLLPMLVSIWVMGLVVIVFVSLSGIGLSELASGNAREFLSALGLHANELGRLYAVAYALLLFTWAEAKDPGAKLALLASMGLAAAALLLTFSRGALGGFIVINALFLLWRRNARALLVLALLAALALFALPDAVYERMTYGFSEGANAISAGRIEGIWLPLLPEVLRSPVFGGGLGSIMWSDAMRREGGVTVLVVTEAHSAYLQTVLDMGFAGLILVGAYLTQVWKGFRALGADPALSPVLRGYYQGAAAGLASLLVSGVTGGFLTPAPDQFFLWLSIGMMYGERQRAGVPRHAD